MKTQRKGFRWGRLSLVIGLCFLLLSACSSTDSESWPELDFTDVDFATSAFKHINNGGLTDDERLPYNIDAISGATVTVEGPAVVSSIPLSMRELENRNEGLARGIYADLEGPYIYEGLDLYYLLNQMVEGENGIILTDTAYSVQIKNSNRETTAEFTLAEVAQAHTDGRPILLAYGIGSLDGETVAPFVFDASDPAERSLGYLEALDNGDGCLKLVYDLDSYGDNPDYAKFANAAYVYLREESEPGFKHSANSGQAYANSRYRDYIIAFRGEALGYELNYTVAQLESLVAYDATGALVTGGVGYSDSYSLANNAYWYVNEYEGLQLYQLLLYLGMESAESMGTGAARTTLISFIADDGVPAQESFSVDTLSYPDAFGFYNKNAADLSDGSYAPTNADLVDTGYPVLLAYGVNHYPYTISKTDDGYLSGLSNSGGPMRVVFGKTQYNHANGSNQVQYLKTVIVGEDILYNTHQYTDVAAHRALANQELTVQVSGEDGAELIHRTLTVGELEDLIYGPEVAGNVQKAAQVKDTYQVAEGSGYQSAIYEGVDLSYLLLEALGLPGTNGTVTFASETEEVTINLDALLRTGYHTELNRDKLPALLAFAQNGAPLVPTDTAPGYIAERPLSPLLASEPASYPVDNSGGPLLLIIPSSSAATCNAISLANVSSISIELIPDAYAHITSPYNSYASNTIRFYGEGLEQEKTYTLAEIENMQTKATTLDFSILDEAGQMTEQRYRGLSLYDLFLDVGVKSNAGDVTVHTADGASLTYSLAAIKRQTYLNQLAPEKEPLSALLAYGAGLPAEDTMTGFPLVASPDSAGYQANYANDSGPLRLIMPQSTPDEVNAPLCLSAVVAVEVGANEINTWGHSMSDIYGEFLDYPFTLTVRNDDHEWSHVFTLAELESMSDLIVHETYTVLDIGECEGLHLWKFIQRYAAGIPGIDDPVSVTVYAADGYKNDLLSVFYKDGLELGITDEDGARKPLIIAYAVNGLPLVDSEGHEGYTGLAGNTAGPLRVVAETNQGASVKYVNMLVVTVPGAGELAGLVNMSLFENL